MTKREIALRLLAIAMDFVPTEKVTSGNTDRQVDNAYQSILKALGAHGDTERGESEAALACARVYTERYDGTNTLNAVANQLTQRYLHFHNEVDRSNS